jgi:hypothetical protein
MSTVHLNQFQDQVSELLLRHRSLLDVLSKHQQAGAGVNRSVIKAITECGCVEVDAKKQAYDTELSADQLRKLTETHVKGTLCDQCMDNVVSQIGKDLFYLSALGNLLHIDLDEVLEKESQKCHTLGLFNMS